MDERMQEYLDQAKRLLSLFVFFSLLHISRSRNTHVDSLATLATSSAQLLPRVILMEDLHRPSMVKAEVAHVHSIRAGPSWMDPLVLYLKEDALPEEKSEADRIRRKATRFWLFEDLNCTSARFQGHTCSAYTPTPQNISWKNCMRGFVEVIQEAGPCPIEP